jgi:anionic cell wall polymer biosynthesis LytR-Cps2A-Psr (LCP) family protein
VKERSSRSIIFLIFIIITVVGAIVIALLLLRTDSVEERVKKGQFVNVLFTVQDKGKVELIEVFLFNPATKKASILYLPNRTWLMLEPLNRYDQLEALYAPGNPVLLQQKIERMIDTNIAYYIDIEADRLVDLVDLLGGLQVLIPTPVKKTVGDRQYLFESGSVVLDGDKVRDFLSLEIEEDSDMEKAQRRQDVLKAFFERLGKYENNGFLSKPEVFSAVQRTIQTNLSAQELRTFLEKTKDLNLEGMLYRRVHGTKRIQNNVEIYIPNDQGDQLKKTMQQAVQFLKNSDQLRPEDLVVNLEILNGTEVAFRARDCSRIYKKYGYEVLREDNAPEKAVRKTVILDRQGNQKLAQEIAAVIKCKNIEVKTDQKTAADITIILGMDFDGQYCQ